MDFFKCLYGLSKGELKVHPVREAQPHVKKVDRELPVEIAEFIFPVF